MPFYVRRHSARRRLTAQFTFKSFAILYLALPQTRGAEFIYAKFLRGAWASPRRPAHAAGSFASAKPTAAPDAHVHVE